METHQISTRAVIDQVDRSDQSNFCLTNHPGENMGIGVGGRLNTPLQLNRLTPLICNCIRFIFRKPWISIHLRDVADRFVTCLRGVDLECIPGGVSRLCNQLGSLKTRFQQSQSFSNRPGLNDLIEKLKWLAAFISTTSPPPSGTLSLQIEKELDEINMHIENDSSEKSKLEEENKMPNPADIQRWELSSEIKSLNAYELSRLSEKPNPGGWPEWHMLEQEYFELLYFLDLDKELPTIKKGEHTLFTKAMSKLLKTIFKVSSECGHSPHDNRGVVLARHIQKILYYLYSNHQRWQNEQDPEIKKNSAVAIRTLTQSTLRKLIIMSESCIDQALVDISSIEVDLFQDSYGFDALNVPLQVAIQLYAYRLDLIKEAVAEVVGNAPDAGDPSLYEMMAIEGLHCDLGFPVPDNCSVLPMPKECSRPHHFVPTDREEPRCYFQMIHEKFFLRYQPVVWLMKIINQHDERQLFFAMSQWYHSKVLKPLDEGDKARIVERLGIDYAEGLGQCTPASVIYFLLHQGIIHAPVRDSAPSQG